MKDIATRASRITSRAEKIEKVELAIPAVTPLLPGS
jgi:uncharacterized membrane protein YjjB (DUF3815 family)